MFKNSRISVGLVGAALLLLFSASTVAAGSGDTSVGSGTTPGPGAGGATRIYPNPAIVDLHRTAWDHVRISRDGKRLAVYFWMGPQACYGLGKVDVVQRGGTLKIKLWTGTQPDAIGMVCPEIAQLFKTVIYLR